MSGLVARLRAAGCVFAEDEAAALLAAAGSSAHLEQLTRRREVGEPLEQVVGQVDFGGRRLAVGPGVFVPRQRSLLLCRETVRLARTRRAPVLLEACAGVAPIAATAAQAVPGLEVHACDVDPTALSYAARNLPGGGQVHCGDLLDAAPRGLRGRVTLLVAVPPYVPVGAAHLLPREARDHEPARALYGGSDGLDHVRALLDQAAAWLAPGAQVLVELHSGQYASAAAHAERAGLRASRLDSKDGQTTVLRGLR